MNHEAQINSLLELDELSVPAAEQLLTLRFSQDTEQRLHELADKSSEGTLSTAEREEYQSLTWAIDFIATLKSQARRVLANGRK